MGASVSRLDLARREARAIDGGHRGAEDAPALVHLDGPWLASLWVHPEHRRQGLGAHLVNHVRQHSRQHRLPRLRLFTADGADWYRRLGWQDEQTAVLNGSAVTIMHCAPAIETGPIPPP